VKWAEAARVDEDEGGFWRRAEDSKQGMERDDDGFDDAGASWAGNQGGPEIIF